MLKEGRILSVFSWKWEWNKITYGWVGDKIMYKRLTMDLRMQKVSRIFSYPTKQESASRILSIRKHVEGHSFPERKQIIINVRQLTRSRCKQCWAHYNLITSLPLAFLFESVFPAFSCCFETTKSCRISKRCVFYLVQIYYKWPNLTLHSVTLDLADGEFCIRCDQSWTWQFYLVEDLYLLSPQFVSI